MKIQVAKAVWSEARAFWALPEKTTHAFAPGATISDRPDLEVGGKLGAERVIGSVLPHEHDLEIRTDSVQETGCGTRDPTGGNVCSARHGASRAEHGGHCLTLHNRYITVTSS